jgi:2-oxoglutarate dehydrogenase E2 component (dihydrolipoamide succinyltransferase)
MSKSNLFILACCVSVSWAILAPAQTPGSMTYDQERALEALRQAEAAPVNNQARADEAARKQAAKVQREQEKLRLKQEKAAKKAAHKKKAAGETAPAVAPSAPVMAPAPVNATLPEDQRAALEALRKAEAAPIIPDQAPPAAPAAAAAPAPVAAPAPAEAPAPVTAPPVTPPPAVAPTSPVAPAPVVAPAPPVVSEPVPPSAPAAPAIPSGQQPALEALRQAESTPVTNAVTPPATAKQQREQDELKLKQQKEAQKAAVAAARKKAKSEAKKETKIAPAPVTTNALSAKEQKLADLLRRYQADEITPYEYHLERAKIISEP